MSLSALPSRVAIVADWLTVLVVQNRFWWVCGTFFPMLLCLLRFLFRTWKSDSGMFVLLHWIVFLVLPETPSLPLAVFRKRLNHQSSEFDLVLSVVVVLWRKSASSTSASYLLLSCAGYDIFGEIGKNMLNIFLCLVRWNRFCLVFYSVPPVGSSRGNRPDVYFANSHFGIAEGIQKILPKVGKCFLLQ